MLPARCACRAPRGARGSQLLVLIGGGVGLGRAPRGARGSQRVRQGQPVGEDVVAPREGRVDRNASSRVTFHSCIGRAPRGARGSQPPLIAIPLPLLLSRPARGAWIATPITPSRSLRNGLVAPREGRVDRNLCAPTYSLGTGRRAPRGARGSQRDSSASIFARIFVAPREGRVDRNLQSGTLARLRERRAPRGGVDRNLSVWAVRFGSPSCPPRGGRG